MIMFSLFTIFSIVFIFLVFLVWKSKNWSKMKKAALSIILAAGLLVAVYASFGLKIHTRFRICRSSGTGSWDWEEQVKRKWSLSSRLLMAAI